MNHIVAITFFLTALTHAALPPEADRKAILAMAGTFAVDFSFRETAAIAKDYELKKPYHEQATEYVTVAEDQPERITLQHLLVVSGDDKKPHVIKHWAQIWTWQDTELLHYHGTERKPLWKKITLTNAQAAGTWSQLVTSVDDSPRYEGYGKWNHANGESFWQSNPTHRPLPRRESTTRDDYDYLLVINRHTITANGWIHWQDNRKVIDRDHQPAMVLCYETGLNSYIKAARPEAEAAKVWWQENAEFWNRVRHFWTSSQTAAPASFTYEKHKDGKRLSRLMVELEKQKANDDAIQTALKPFLATE